MTRSRLPLSPGQEFRSPALPSARWHKVIACRRRKDGTVYVNVRRSRFWRLLGFGPVQRIEMAMLNGIGFELRKS